MTRRHHYGDPRADVELIDGFFPGCCQAGVGDALWVRGAGDGGRFSPHLLRAMADARTALAPAEAAPAVYRVRENQTGRQVQGVGCAQLTPEGCRLGELKAPLCLGYLCDAVRGVLATPGGWDLVGAEADDFCGAGAAVGAVVRGARPDALAEVAGLEERLAALGARLAASAFSPAAQLARWLDGAPTSPQPNP